MNRREMTLGCCAAIAAYIGEQFTSFAFGPQSSSEDILVVLFLRGGSDGLSLLAPVNDPYYIAAREDYLRVRDSGNNAGLLLNNLTGDIDFRFHPKANGLKELFDSQQLSIIQACGLMNGTRSHFDAMDLIERGTTDKKTLSKGWITMYLEHLGLSENIPALSIGKSIPGSLAGAADAIAIENLVDFSFRGNSNAIELLEKMYLGHSIIDVAGRKTLETIKLIKSRMLGLSDSPNAKYKAGNKLGQSLKTVAQVIKMDIGLKVATVDFGGWDNHERQDVLFPYQVESLSESLLAFYNDINSYHSKVTLVIMSEFGRRLKANKSGGTDHGHGNLMLVLGGNTNGGKIYGKWPGLATEQLDNQVDLAVTTDYRSVLSEVLIKRGGVKNIEKIFPKMSDLSLLNFMK